MDLKFLAIRELIKEADDSVATISEKGGPLDVSDPMAQQLFNALVTAYGRRSTLTHGSFNQENSEGYPFISGFENFIKGPVDEGKFLHLCDQALAQLAASLQQPSARSATGGYAIFIYYSSDVFDYLLIALVRDKTGLAFDEELNPTKVIEVDLEKLHQAAKINITTYKEDSDSYLSFIGTRQQGNITHYFSNALGCTDVVPSKKSTSDLIRASEDFCRRYQLQEKQDEIVEDVVSYLSRQREDRQSAYLPDVEKIFDDHLPPEHVEKATGAFGKFANSEDYQVSQEFQPHTSTINAYTQVKTKMDNWQLDFARRSLGHLHTDSEIEFDAQTNSLRINRLSTKVIAQLKEALDIS
ncbi:nucleoid-associated protein [Amphritea japonica]|uniref:Nucleoid-associated protein n=1 Tax=Amphritea japonica ATCC BAA-1530 TaxID=1278309 RepID=A0A7R6PE87_9GAMM|nr:nucleoid-associated protein [Amphritea japonica]BBB26546.1 nucleoid-associated protein [Amphritea japonica ATCC BAA-1530]